MQAAHLENSDSRVQLNVALKVSHLDLDPEAAAKSGLGSLFSSSSRQSRKNERVHVKLSESKEYTPGERAPSLIFDEIFTTETLDVPASSEQDVAFSLSAILSCADGLDKKIQANVVLNSPDLTKGKESVVGGATVSFRELLRHLRYGKPVVLDLTSVLFPQAKCHIYLLPRLPVPLHTSVVGSSAPPKMKNPLRQSYAFWDVNPRTHEPQMVAADEYSIEPKLTFKVALAFIEQIHAAMAASAAAWKQRYEWERIRQGYFSSADEAFLNDYVQVRVSVLKARDISLPDPEQESKSGESFYSTALAYAARLREGNLPRYKKKSSTEESTHTRFELHLEEPGQLFATIIGRTNTEYATKEPKYGRNKNLNKCPHSQPDSEFEVYDSAFLLRYGSGPQEFTFYVKRDAIRTTSLRLTLQQDMYTVMTGKSYAARGRAHVLLADAGMFSEPSWLPVNNIDEDNTSIECGDVLLQVRILDSLADAQLNQSDVQRFTLHDPEQDLTAALTQSVDQLAMLAEMEGESTQEPDENIVDTHIPTLNPKVRPTSVEQTEPISTLAELKMTSTDSSPGVCVNVTGYDPVELIRDCYAWLWYIGFRGVDPLSDIKTDTMATLPVNVAMRGVSDTLRDHNRVDVKYPLAWLKQHCIAVTRDADLLGRHVEVFRSWVREGRTFRSSQLKKQMELQNAPINLHYQFLVLRPVPSESEEDAANHGEAGRRPGNTVFVDFVSVGACTTHGLGYKHGGLVTLEHILRMQKQQVDTSRQNLLAMTEGSNHLPPEGAAFELQTLLTQELLAFETACVEIGMRRVFVISQALSISVNAILSKLELIVEDAIPDEIARQWVNHGILLYFEGLLSTSGKERGMLEDTHMALTVVGQYSVQLCDRERFRQSPDDHPLEAFGNSVGLEGADVCIRGRQLMILLPTETFDMLPDFLQAGTVLNMLPVLFTQGIDVKQSMVNVLGDSGDALVDGPTLQHRINQQALSKMNAYCHACKPITQARGDDTSDSATQMLEIHPLLETLHDFVESESIFKKNIDGLIEAERVCKMLHGVRVTFCKSGKDRTGMAITLEQSRALSEFFGFSFDEQRLLKDANLMRRHGTRLQIAEKNIGRPVYSINKLQTQFMPVLYRPPPETQEQLVMGTMNRDTS